MGPKVGAQARDIPFDTQFLLIEIEEDENYALMLPLVDNGFRAFLHYGDDSDIEIICAAESGDAAVASNGCPDCSADARVSSDLSRSD